MNPRRFIWAVVREPFNGTGDMRETYVCEDTVRQFVFLRAHALLYEGVPHFYVLRVLRGVLEHVDCEVRVTSLAKRNEPL